MSCFNCFLLLKGYCPVHHLNSFNNFTIILLLVALGLTIHNMKFFLIYTNLLLVHCRNLLQYKFNSFPFSILLLLLILYTYPRKKPKIIIIVITLHNLMTLKKLKGDQVYIYRFYYINLFIFFIFFLRIQVIIWCHFLTSFPTHLLCFVTVEYTTSLCITFPVSSTILLIYTYCVMQLVFKSVKKMQLYS